jgi:CubicO group peptidase (beta-lactamase class C family)
MVGSMSNHIDFQPLDALIQAAMARLQVPGAAVGVINGDQIHTAGFGVTNINHPLLIDADTLFQVGSITKTFTGTAAMRLVEIGKLDLDTPLRAYLPGLELADETTAARVTMRHLLTHTPGWQTDYFFDPGSNDDALAQYIAGMKSLPQITPVGEVWAYNSPGINLAGRVIEVLSGKIYEKAIHDLVLAPLGMHRSFFFAEDVITHRVAAGHYLRGEAGLQVNPAWAIPRSMHPSGGLVTTVNDMLHYLRFHLGLGSQMENAPLLSPASLTLMQSPLVKAGGKADACGLNWMLKELRGGRLVRHGGGTSGQWSECLMVPELSFALLLLTNAEAGDILNNEVSRWALQHFTQLEEATLDIYTPSEQTLIAYSGFYDTAFATVDLKVQHGELVAQVTYKCGFPTPDAPPPPKVPPVRCAFYKDDRMVVIDAPLQGYRGEFIAATGGGPAWLRFNGRLYVRQNK